MVRMVEVCCGSYYDCLQAEKGGASRVELNSALYMGGLTPSVGTLRLVKKQTNLKVVAMVRPRGAGFHYEKEDFEVMLCDAQSMLENGADGIAFGCLRDDGSIDIEQSKQIVDLIHKYKKEAVFHRAFDCVKEPFQAMEQMIALNIDRVLTSGLAAKAVDGKELLLQLQQRYGEDIEILAGSGMNASNAKKFMDETGITQIHSSCKAWKKDATTVTRQVSYAYASTPFEQYYDVVDENIVKEIIQTI